MSPRNAPRLATVYGVDTGKNVFHVVGLESGGEPVQRARFRRDTLLQFFEHAAPAIVGMERALDHNGLPGDCDQRPNGRLLLLRASLRYLLCRVLLHDPDQTSLVVDVEDCAADRA